MNAYGITIFCDDIRSEITGKAMLIGVYSGEMAFSEPAPGVLPTFAAYATLMIPLAIKIQNLAVRMVLEVDGVERELGSAATSSTDDLAPLNLMPADADEKSMFKQVIVPFHLTGLLLEKNCMFKVRADLNGEMIQLGVLNVVFPEAPADIPHEEIQT